MKGDDTKDRIKLAARRLFAAKGIDGVSIREIVAAAGQRNVGSLHYYFRTKEALVREIIIDGAGLINARRVAKLDELERDGGPKRLRDVIDIMIWPAINPGGDQENEEHTYLRFILMLLLNHRPLFMDALGGRTNTGYERCLVHVRRFLPHLPVQIVDQRLVFVSLYMSSMLAAREASFDRNIGPHPFWTRPYTMNNLADTVQALLEGPVSLVTQDEFDRVLPELEGIRDKDPVFVRES